MNMSENEALPEANESAHDATPFGSGTQRTKRMSSKYGKSLRKAVPRDVFAYWRPSIARLDPIDLIFTQEETRVPELIPLRHARMSANPFAFYRGAAVIMASDLSELPTTGIEVQVCGDAHLANFGFFLSPERRIVFDINDFDETTRGPWEWDVARLAASVEIMGRERGLEDMERDACVIAAVRGYRKAMRKFANMGHLDTWYFHVDMESLWDSMSDSSKDKVSEEERRGVDKVFDRMRRKGSSLAFHRFTEVVDDELRIISSPPEIVPINELMDLDIDITHFIDVALSSYMQTLPPERARLLERYHGVGIARKAVGVGSVGTRCWIVLFEGADENDPLVLQVKEANDSALQRFIGKAGCESNGQRVVEGQHAMQSVSDAFLGWMPRADFDGEMHDYYVRQLWDGKGSVNLMTVEPDVLKRYCKLAGIALAHAHARTGDRFAIASYLGGGDRFDQAMLSFSKSYADQNARDYQTFLERLQQ